MEVVRNIQVKLDVSDEDSEVLDETFEQFNKRRNTSLTTDGTTTL